MLTVYGYQKCSTCRDALKWLDARSLIYQVKAIRETPPTPAELTTALKAMGGDLRKLFNTSGIDYRALGLKDQLPSMSEASAFELLSKNGNLVKRPFLIGDGKVLVGFKEPEWEKALGWTYARSAGSSAPALADVSSAASPTKSNPRSIALPISRPQKPAGAPNPVFYLE